MGRIGLAVVLALSLFAVSIVAETQEAGKVYRMGLLLGTAVTQEKNELEALRGGLRELGYAEGKNIVIEYRSAGAKYDRYPELAAELVRLGVDVIVTGGTAATQAAMQATTTIPIVMTATGDPLRTGSSSALHGQAATSQE